MGFIPRRRIKENLRELDVFIEDTNNSIFIVQELPDTFVQGRTAFKIFGSNFLKENIPLKIEILDRDGNPVWTQPVIYGQKSSPSLPYRYISVEVYPPPYNVPGNAELTIVGELDDTKFDIPRELIGTYNVRFSKIINIDTEKIINENPILFYKKPIATATEFVVAQKQTEPPLTRFISGSGLSGTVNQDIKGNSFLSGSQVDTKTEVNDKSESPSGDLKAQANLYKYKTGLYKTNKVMQRRGLKQEKKSPEPPQMRIRSSEKKFITKLVGSDINVNNISLPTSSVLELTGLDPREISIEDIYNSVTFPDYTGKVEDISSDEEIILNKPYAIEFKDPTKPTSTPPVKIFTDIGDIEDSVLANFTASYTDWQAPTVSGYRFDSFIDFTIDDMRTFSGDVYRIKVSGGSDSSQGDFSVLLDTVVDSPELIVDTTSPSGVLRSGYFIDQAHIDKYWNTFGGNNNTNQLSAFYTMSLADGMYLSGSYEQYNQVGRVDLDATYPFTVKKDVPYTLTLNVKGKRGIKTNVEGISNQSAKLFFHLSGSNLKDFDESDIQYASSFGGAITDEFGNIVGVEITDDEQISGFKDFGRVSHTFTPSFKLDRVKNIDTTIQLRIHSGEWIISDLSLSSATSTGFSPDEFTLRVPIPPNTLRPDNYDFLIEYLDINGNTAETVTFLDNVPISGSALILEGTDNLLTGSLFMGSAAGQGIESAGANSAFIRSVGYKGFLSASNATGVNSGFMMFSGSVLPDESDDYKGVGLEMVANSSSYFKFRSDPSELDIRADAFFIGDEDSAFVSGSQGNIEISSSKFHLSPGGDVVMNNITASNANLSGKITATSGDIGGFAVEDGQLSSGAGVNSVTMSGDLGLIAMGTGSSFNKSSMAGGLRMGFDTDGQFKFALGSAGSYIHFDSDGVSIKSDSFDVTASVADINVDQFGLTSTNLVISSSGQFIAAGSTVPSGVTGTNKGFFVSAADNQLLIGNAAGGHFIFDGTNVSVSSSAFYLGNDTNFISGSQGNIQIQSSGTTVLSGSEVRIETPKFYMGEESQYISGSEGNIEISSSNFHLQADGDVVMSGTVTSTAGAIGGFEIDTNQINSSNDNVILKSSGQITASAIQLTGEVNIIGGSAKGQLDTLGAETASIKARTASFENSVTSLGAKTSSFAGSIVLIGQKTASFQSSVTTLGQKTASIEVDSGSLAAAIQLTSASLNILNSDSNIISEFGANTFVGLQSSEHVKISPSGLELKDASTTLGTFNAGGAIIGKTNEAHISASSLEVSVIKDSNNKTVLGSLGLDITQGGTNVARFAAVTRLGDVANEHISMSSAGFSVKDGTTQLSTFNAGGAIIGKTNEAHISASSLEVNVIKDSNNKAVINSSGLNVTQGGNVVGVFGATTTIGINGTTAEHVILDGTGLTIKDGSTVRASLLNTAITLNGASTADRVVIDEDGMEIYTADVLKASATDAGFTAFGDDVNTKAVMSSAGMTVFNDGTVADPGTGVSHFGANLRIGAIADNTSRLEIDTSGNLKIINRQGTTDTTTIELKTTGAAEFAGKVTAESGEIGGFTIASTQISSDNLIISSNGTLETADYTSDSKGWRISSLDNGMAEFENAKIRGTLSTAVFEKETVNAVGGQLYIANSSALTGSGMISASFTTMSVVNATGFTGSYGGDGEILSLKKVTSTGFSTEYVKIQSSSRDIPSSDTNFVGQLYVVRGYSGSAGVTAASAENSSSIGEAAGSAQSYQPGQVIVSTGRVGTGFIRLNANPNDHTTPYMDIAERTGSAVYDVDLKVRLGDLSGLSAARVGADPGFGLFTERAFLTKDVTVGTLATEHIVIDATSLVFKDGTTSMAELRGTTWTLGGAHGATDDAIVMSPDSGVTIFDSSTDKAVVSSLGLDITQNNVNVARFAAITRIGDVANDHVSMSSAGFSIKDGTTQLSTFNAGGAIIGKANVAHISASSLEVNVIKDSDNKAVLGSLGLDITQGGTNVARFAAITRIGDVANEHISMSSAGLFVKDGTTQLSTFNAGGAIIGKTNEAHISASSVDLSLIFDSNNKAVLDSNSLDFTIGGNQVATFGANPIITGGTVTIRNHTNNNDKVVISENKMEIFDNNNAVATFAANTVIEGGTVTIQNTTNANDKVVLSENKLEIFDNNNVVAEFAATTTIGNTSNEHVSISGSGLELKDGSAQRFAVNSSGLAIGDNFNVDTSGNVSMSGVISAAAGQLATFTITSGSIDSDTGNVKRGLKLVPGDSIRGYGSEAHKTTSTGGKFSFGTGAIAPSATAGVAYDRNIAAPDLPGTG